VSITQVTTYAGWLTALAIVALIATGWRRTARASVDQRARAQAAEVRALTELHAPLDTRTHWLKRLWSIVAGFGLAIWVGAAAAAVIGFGTAYLVITLTNMLKR